ncbi:MAG: transposase [Pseudomonadota bacterium]|nr:transposase [Pseudomonadota bacterium]
MSLKRYTEEFKIEAASQGEVADRLGVSRSALREWVKYYSLNKGDRYSKGSQEAELRKLRADLKRVAEERDILKKCASYFAKMSR